MLKQIENYIFDLDGTLINSSNEIIKCLKQAFNKANINIDEKKLTSDIIGPPIHQIIESISDNVDENSLKQIIKNFRHIYDYDAEDSSFLYEGVLKELIFFKTSGKRLFIATFKPHIPTMRLMDLLNLNMFETAYTIDYPKNFSNKTEIVNTLISKYKLDKNKTVMIGDASSDMIAAKENGILGVGALWGYGSDKSLLKEHADLVINKIEDLKWLKLNYQII